MSALQHVGLRVDDLETGISFYQEVLDAKLSVGPITMGPPGAAAFMNGPPETSFRLAMLTVDGGVILELFEFVGDDRPEWASRGDGLLPHAGFVVRDVPEVLGRAEAAGASRCWPEPVTVGGAEMIYLSDPFGNTFELMDVPGTSLVDLLLDLYPEGVPA
jgi:catechol 2,3-dioxygenase-like lactoylglutathione lyase family enzyme